MAGQARDEISDVPWERQGDPGPESGRGVWIQGGRRRERGRLGGGWIELFHLGQLELLLPWRGIRVDQDARGVQEQVLPLQEEAPPGPVGPEAPI